MKDGTYRPISEAQSLAQEAHALAQEAHWVEAAEKRCSVVVGNGNRWPGNIELLWKLVEHGRVEPLNNGGLPYNFWNVEEFHRNKWWKRVNLIEPSKRRDLTLRFFGGTE